MRELLLETKEILAEVDRVTGWPVEIIADSEQPHLARMTRARSGVPAHLLRLDPTVEAADYLVAYQCGFVIRLFKHEPDDRKEFAVEADKVRDVEQMLRRGGTTARLPDGAISQLAQQLFQGILIQLRSYPIGFRIDRWLYEAYPTLREQQGIAIDRQLQDNLSILKPEVKGFSPKRILDANAAMNASYAIFADRLYGRNQNAIPWRAAGYEKAGRKLLGLMEEIPPDPTYDEKLVDAWAQELELGGWYSWVKARP